MRGCVAVAILVSFLCGICVPSSAVTELDDHHNGNGGRGSGGALHMPIYRQFSNALRQKARELGLEWAFEFPSIPENTPEYYRRAVRHDLARHGRNLADNEEALTFSDGNLTIEFTEGIQYGSIEVGTPKVSHLVALDTGSDLFWLPCDCSSCATAPASAPSSDSNDFFFNPYYPTLSNTSEEIACNNALCSANFSQCTRLGSPGTTQCSYEVNNAPANTSTSGALYEDVIYLTQYETPTSNVTATVVVGCSQTQSGLLLDGSYFLDGLLGLGRAPFSVPSRMAKAGIIGDSFSMCFNEDGAGRIAFGDFGSSNILTTPFLTGSNRLEAGYFVQVETIQIGSESLNVDEAFLVDSATSFTYLRNDTYTAVLDAFDKQVSYPKLTFHEGDEDDIFELCFETTDIYYTYPNVTFELAGGASMPIYFPVAEYIYLANHTLAGFCLAVLEGGNISSIFGGNFMVDYNLVFNREEGTLGVENIDCYDVATFPSPSP